MGQKNIFYLFFIATALIFGCENKKGKPKEISLNKTAQKADQSFATVEDAQIFLNQYLEDTNTFERELRNLLNNSPDGNIEQATNLNNNLVEVLVSVKYQLQTSAALIDYYNRPIDCIEQLGNMQVGCSIGNGCTGSFRTLERFGDIQLNDQTLELLNVEILLHGSVKWFDETLIIEDIENGVYENIKYICENSKITPVL